MGEFIIPGWKGGMRVSIIFLQEGVLRGRDIQDKPLWPIRKKKKSALKNTQAERGQVSIV